MKHCYFSVGKYTGDIKTGSPNITIAGGIAIFSLAQISNGLGVGDEVIFNGTTKVYLSSKISTTEWNVINNLGFPADNQSSVAVDSIKRCFNTLASALEYSVGVITGIGYKIGSNDFITADVQPTVMCYDDKSNFSTSEDTAQVLCQGNGQGIITDGYITDTSHKIIVKVPYDTSLECNRSQRHIGVSGQGYHLNVTGGDYAAFFDLLHADVEGLDVSGTSVIGLRFRGFTHSQVIVPVIAPYHAFSVKQCLIHNSGTKGVTFEIYDAAHGHPNNAYNKPWMGFVLNSIIWNQSLRNIETYTFGMIAAQTVGYGGEYGIWKYSRNPGFDSKLMYNVFLGHSIADLYNVDLCSILASDISDTDTFIPTGEGGSWDFPSPGVIIIGDEQIYFTGIDWGGFSGCTRGYNGTTPASHLIGSLIGSASTATENNYNRTEYPWMFGGQNNDVLANPDPSLIFLDASGGDFHLAEGSELYHAALRGDYLELSDPDIENISLPIIGGDMSIGAFSDGSGALSNFITHLPSTYHSTLFEHIIFDSVNHQIRFRIQTVIETSIRTACYIDATGFHDGAPA